MRPPPVLKGGPKVVDGIIEAITKGTVLDSKVEAIENAGTNSEILEPAGPLVRMINNENEPVSPKLPYAASRTNGRHL